MNETIVKHLNFGEDAQSKIFTGIDKLTKAVSSTLGASGRCVIMEDGSGNPQITKDGVTVADSIVLLDPVENMGAKLIKEAARRTVQEAGDGTTTATVLAHAILKEAYNAIKSNNIRDVKNGINLAVEKVVRYLEKNSSKVIEDKIKQVATISANNDEFLGEVISEAFNLVGKNGLVIMETHDNPTTSVEVIDGIKYDQGFSNPHLATNKVKNEVELTDAVVLILESPVENIRKIQNVLEYVITNNKSLLIIGDLEPQVSNALAMNKVKGNIKINIVPAPTYGVNRKSTLDDLALLTGASIVSENLGDDFDLINEEMLGYCSKVVSNSIETIIQIENLPEEANALVDKLKLELESCPEVLKRNLETRISRLQAKAAIIQVGANSEVELKEKRDRVEDAICATKAAIKEGIIPGGGVALVNAAKSIKAKSTGEEVLLNACCVPFATILENAGITELIMPKGKGKGIDVVTGKTVSMVKSGIIDPLLVTKSALRNAASVATTILSTDCVINNLRA